MTATARLLDAVDRVPWSAYAGPQLYNDGEPPRAFRVLTTAQNRSTSDSAYHGMLFAIGNDHAGTYYSAARPAIPLLVQAAATLDEWPRRTAIEVLTDLILSFHPEDGETQIEDVFVEAVEEHTGVVTEDAKAALALLKQ